MANLFNIKKMIILSFYLTIFLIVIFLTIHQSSAANYSSDLGMHIVFIKKYFEGQVYIPHPVWHTLVHYMTDITLNVKFAASIVTALFVMMWVYIVQMLYTYFVGKDRKDIYLYLFLFIIFIIGPAFIPSFSKYVIAGIGGPNIWNNVTLITVKPFAILTVFFTVLSLEKKNTYYYIISAIALLISIFAKPSFVIAFLPALALLIVIKKMYTKTNIIYFASLSLMSVVALAYQFLNTFGEGKGKIIISFLGVWSAASPCVLISILLAIMFPLLYTVFNFNYVKKNNYIILIWFMTFISILYAAFLAEEGPRFYHGNFFWSYMVSLALLYAFILIDYFKNMPYINKYKKLFLNAILLWQVIIGLLYFIKLMQGYDPAGLLELSKIF